MQTTDLRDMLRTVEAIRRERHPDLDPNFLEAIVRAEEQNQEDDLEAIRVIEVALKALLATKGVA